MMCGKRILVVEEREDIQKVLKLGLEMESGWQVIAISEQKEIVNLVKDLKLDAIILDTVTDNYLKAIEQLKTNPLTRNIPIVAIAPSDRTAEKLYLERLGVAVAIPEMFDPSQLVATIAQKFNW